MPDEDRHPGHELVSIIMPAYNVRSFVAEAVNTLHSQSWENLELVIVDDGSTDGTLEELHRLAQGWSGDGRQMNVISQANAGAGSARNTGLAAARGRVVGFFDADDRCDADCVEKLATALLDAPDVDIAFPQYRTISTAGVVVDDPAPMVARRMTLSELAQENIIHSPLIRKDAARAAEGFDPGLTACIDFDFYLKIAAQRAGNILMIGDTCADYRRREGQITSDWRRMEMNWMTVMNKPVVRSKLSDGQFSRARGRNCLYWSTLAYQSGDYSAARRLAFEMWRRAPRFALTDRHAIIRTLAGLTALLPGPVHDRIRRGFNSACGAADPE